MTTGTTPSAASPASADSTSPRHEDLRLLRDLHPCHIAGRPHLPTDPDRLLEVRDKWTGAVATRVARADETDLEHAIDAAHAARRAMRRLPAHRRRRILDELAGACLDREDDLARLLAIEAGKPLRHARSEVARLVDTLRIAGEEAVRTDGEVLRLDRTVAAEGRRGFVERMPAGVVGCITPWNFPLNLVAHKIGPAIASGCPFVLKPASATPTSALVLGDLLHETGLLPDGAFSILPMDSADADALVEDDRIARLSFTGSAEVGWSLKQRCRRKGVSLELGGNAPVIVERDAEVEDACDRIVYGAFHQSGQSCIAVQRIYVHESVYDEVRDGLLRRTRELVVGDPLDEDTFVGPVITEADARRIEDWTASAVEAGASLLCGGGREGTLVEPTLLEDASPKSRVDCEEVFGPVAVLHRFATWDDAVLRANDSRYGLQAGVFTRDLDRIEEAFDELAFGGVIINDVPSWRVDSMPYGGVKDSGIGREGIRWAIEEMTDLRLLVVRSRRAAG